MNTRQWVCLSGQHYAYINHDEQNEWMTFIRGTPEVLEEVLTDKLIYRLEADWARLMSHGDDAREMLEELLVRDQKASAALAAKARQWVEEELPKLRASHKCDHCKAVLLSPEAWSYPDGFDLCEECRFAHDWNEDHPIGTEMSYTPIGSPGQASAKTRGRAFVHRGVSSVHLEGERDPVSIMGLSVYSPSDRIKAELNEEAVKREEVYEQAPDRPLHEKDRQFAVDRFNEWFPVGTAIEYKSGLDWIPAIINSSAFVGSASDCALVTLIEVSDVVSIFGIRCPQPENVEAEHGVRGTEYEFKSARELAEMWNKNHPVGTSVELLGEPGQTYVKTNTVSEAFASNHTAMIYVEGITVRIRLYDCVAI